MKKIIRIIIVFFIIVICIILGKVYTITRKSSTIPDFQEYLNKYKVEIENYNLDSKKEEINQLISSFENSIANREYDKLSSLRLELSNLKEELEKNNLEILNTDISQLESIDISMLDDKDSIELRIENIKNLRDKSLFVKASEEIVLLRSEIENKVKEKEEYIINKNFESFDGYWIGELDKIHNVFRIDIKNNTVYDQTFKSLKHPLNGWTYDSDKKIYTIDCEWETPNPEIGKKDYYFEIEYINDNTIRVFDNIYHKVNYEQAAYFIYYTKLISPVGSDGNIYDNISFLDGFEVAGREKKIISDLEAKEIISRYYSESIDKGYNIDSFSVRNIELIPEINSYFFSCQMSPINIDKNNSSETIFRFGILLENGIVVPQYTKDLEEEDALNDLKSEILNYYE